MAGDAPTALLIDFDGTAALDNVGMALIHAFARDDSWRVIDEDYERGRVGSRQAYQLMGPLLGGTIEEWRAWVLENHRLDPSLPLLTRLALERGWLVEILSDGIDLYIDALLAKEGVQLTVRSSLLKPASIGAKVESPFVNPLCGRCGTCKSDRILELENIGYSVIFIGDGLSDLCAAPKAGRIFAKDVLAAHLSGKGVPFEPFGSLHDIVTALFGAAAERIPENG